MDNFLDNLSFEINAEADIILMESIWKAMSEDELWTVTDSSPASSSVSESEAATPPTTPTMEDIWKMIEEGLGLSDSSTASSEDKEASLEKDKVLANICTSIERDLMLMKSKVDLDATLSKLGDSWKAIEGNLGITDLKDDLQTEIWKLIEDDLLSLLLFSNLPLSELKEASAATELKDVWELIEDDVIGPFLASGAGATIRNE